MAEKPNVPPQTLALSTKLEEDFVSPLTAVRGALEILRDFPELAQPQRQRFVETALIECARLEKGIEHLASTVYAAGQREAQPAATVAGEPAGDGPASRIHMFPELDVVELDLDEFEFSSSKLVNEFYDVLDRLIEASGRSWYFVVNYRGCSIWPEAWVAFAHRGKKINVSYSLGTVRYAEAGDEDSDSAGEAGAASENRELFASREEAFAHVAALREAVGARTVRR